MITSNITGGRSAPRADEKEAGMSPAVTSVSTASCGDGATVEKGTFNRSLLSGVPCGRGGAPGDTYVDRRTVTGPGSTHIDATFMGLSPPQSAVAVFGRLPAWAVTIEGSALTHEK